MDNCKFCNSLDIHGLFIWAKFASCKEEIPLKDYTGGYFKFSKICNYCALRINHIIHQFPKEATTKK
jgi:hypothetical protein